MLSDFLFTKVMIKVSNYPHQTFTHKKICFGRRPFLIILSKLPMHVQLTLGLPHLCTMP